MQTILVAGAGKSSTFLIQYLLSQAPSNNWKVIIADGDAGLIAEKAGSNACAVAKVIDITNSEQREPLVAEADIVVSLMPPHLHVYLAKDCLKHKKNLITSSYVSDELKQMHDSVKDAGLMFMCEMGLDPGIDHMTASKMIHEIHDQGGVINSFKSYCGGLIAPESDDNPWHYKFTWNPKNIITAGVAGGRYLLNGVERFVPYQHIFEDNECVEIDGVGKLAWYANRDTLKYLELYDTPEIQTFLRATLRYPDFCDGWQMLIALGLTQLDDTFETHGLSYADWVRKKLGTQTGASLEAEVAAKLGMDPDGKVMQMLRWADLFSDKPLPAGWLTSGDILLDLLLGKWGMAPHDKDMVVMQHEIIYKQGESVSKLTSTMVIKGDDREHSAMAKTVGMPMALLAHRILDGSLKPPHGVLIPNMPEIYNPLLAELTHHGITFNDVRG